MYLALHSGVPQITLISTIIRHDCLHVRKHGHNPMVCVGMGGPGAEGSFRKNYCVLQSCKPMHRVCWRHSSPPCIPSTIQQHRAHPEGRDVSEMPLGSHPLPRVLSLPTECTEDRMLPGFLLLAPTVKRAKPGGGDTGGGPTRPLAPSAEVSPGLAQAPFPRLTHGCLHTPEEIWGT